MGLNCWVVGGDPTGKSFRVLRAGTQCFLGQISVSLYGLASSPVPLWGGPLSFLPHGLMCSLSLGIGESKWVQVGQVSSSEAE